MKKHEVSRSTSTFEFDGGESWTEFMNGIGKQLD